MDDHEVHVSIPVRIDLAGGWSDVHYFSAREGGSVLNAAISPTVRGHADWIDGQLDLHYSLDLPPGAHLGTSSALDVAWLALTRGLMGQRPEPIELAEQAYRLEKLLGVEGGKQDQYAAALGGFNVLDFGAQDQPARVERLQVPLQIVAELQERCVLCNAGPSAVAGSGHETVWKRYRAGDETIATSLRTLRDTVRPARDALLAGDFERLADLLTANREAARTLYPGNVTPRMDELFSVGERAGALGSKACGEGGGGCVLFLCKEDTSDAVRAALETQSAEIVEFAFVSRPTW